MVVDVAARFSEGFCSCPCSCAHPSLGGLHEPRGPATKVDYPARGKVIIVMAPWPGGGPADVSTRILMPEVEKSLGATIEVVNKGGAGTQVGMTELAQAKPDGYTIGQVTLPTLTTLHLNPERQPVFGRSSFQRVADTSNLNLRRGLNANRGIPAQLSGP